MPPIRARQQNMSVRPFAARCASGTAERWSPSAMRSSLRAWARGRRMELGSKPAGQTEATGHQRALPPAACALAFASPWRPRPASGTFAGRWNSPSLFTAAARHQPVGRQLVGNGVRQSLARLAARLRSSRTVRNHCQPCRWRPNSACDSASAASSSRRLPALRERTDVVLRSAAMRAA